MRGLSSRPLRFAGLLSGGLAALGGVHTVLKYWGSIVDLFSLPEDISTMVAAVPQFEADWGLYIFLLGLFGLTATFLLPLWQKKRSQTIEVDNPEINRGLPLSTVQVPRIDRQPIYRAFEYILDTESFEDDGNQVFLIAGLLRQAALDEEIVIWGAEPSFIPVDMQPPILLKIDRDYWRHYEITAHFLIGDTSDLHEKGCTTESVHKIIDPQIYWHLHVDMNEIRARWPEGEKPSNE